MEKQIRSDLIKMIAMMVVMVGLGIYAQDFVINGIKAKAALNLSIFALFGLAAWFAFRHVLNLKNEVLALKALQVDYGIRERRPLDPYKHPAIVFQDPELLGNGYRLIAEEMSKQENVQISNATVQTILHDVDQRINDRKSTIMYFSGLMVFLGLLGAFMGLMKTVGSVGDLIGGMDISGGGGTDSFGVLIEGMKGPLNGMSVGFSSSLFGLMTSMVLGALERCMTSAMKALRNEFEHWLSNVAALEAPQTEGTQRETAELGNVIRALDLGGKHLRDLRETVLDSALTQEQTNKAVAEMNSAVASLGTLVEKVSDPAPMLKPIADCVAELAHNQSMMVSQFNGLIDGAQRDRDAIRNALERMEQLAGQQSMLNGSQLHSQLDKMTALQADLLAKEPATVTVSHYSGGAGGAGGSGSIFSRISGLFGRGAGESAGTRRERKRLRSEIRRMLIAQRKMVRNVERTLGTSVDRLEAGREQDSELIAQLTVQHQAHNARLAVLMGRLQMIDEDRAGASDELHLMTGMHGARREMEVLKSRLDALQETDVADEPQRQPMQDDDRANGTTGTAKQ